jgi:hypothetical protein
VQAGVEEWRTELFVIQITVLRCIVVRIATFAFFVVSLQSKMNQFACWESFIGAESYKCVVTSHAG